MRKAKVVRFAIAKKLDCICVRYQGQDLNYTNVSWYSDCRRCYGTGMTPLPDFGFMFVMKQVNPYMPYPKGSS